jgi:hypothetical protein
MSFLVSWVKGWILPDRLAMNRLMYANYPCKDHRYFKFFGGGSSMIVLILSGSISIPLWSIINPKNLPDDTMNAHFNGFSLSACSLTIKIG